MNLAMRLKTSSIVQSHRYWFRYRGETLSGIHLLIDTVLDRYASRFGRISNNHARNMQARLMQRYCHHTGSTRAALRCDYLGGFSYPKAEAIMAHLAELDRQYFTDDLTKAYQHPAGDYCEVESRQFCEYCGAVFSYTTISSSTQRRYTERKTILAGLYLFSSMVCHDRRCRAVASIYKRQISPEKKLIDAIFDACNDTKKFNQLRKHFVPDARRPAKRQNFPRTGHAHREDGATSLPQFPT